jgi:hypothetical protein
MKVILIFIIFTNILNPIRTDQTDQEDDQTDQTDFLVSNDYTDCGGKTCDKVCDHSVKLVCVTPDFLYQVACSGILTETVVGKNKLLFTANHCFANVSDLFSCWITFMGVNGIKMTLSLGDNILGQIR